MAQHGTNYMAQHGTNYMAQHGTILHGTSWHSMAPYYMAQHGTILDGISWHSMAPNYMAQQGTAGHDVGPTWLPSFLPVFSEFCVVAWALEAG